MKRKALLFLGATVILIAAVFFFTKQLRRQKHQADFTELVAKHSFHIHALEDIEHGRTNRLERNLFYNLVMTDMFLRQALKDHPELNGREKAQASVDMASAFMERNQHLVSEIRGDNREKRKEPAEQSVKPRGQP